MKKLLLLFTVLLGLTLSANAETVTVSQDLSKNNWSPKLPTSSGSFNKNLTNHTSTTNQLTYQINKAYINSNYTMLTKGATIILPKVNGIVTSISVKSSSGTSTKRSMELYIDGSLKQTLLINKQNTVFSFTLPAGQVEGSVYKLVNKNEDGGNLQLVNVTFTYEVTGEVLPTLEAPEFSQADGYAFSSPFDLTISAEEGATIYYTLDGTDPTDESDEYVEPITISETTTVKAYAVAEGYNDSPITTATYTYFDPSNIKQYGLVTSADQLVLGGNFLIASSTKDGDAYAVYEQNSNNRNAGVVTINGGIIVVNPTTKVYPFELRNGKKEDTYSFFDANKNGYLYAASSSSNYLRTETTLSDNSSANIYLMTGYESKISFQGSYTRNIMRYNEDSKLFSCYNSSSSVVGKTYLYAELKYVYICDETSKGDVQIISITDENGEAVTVSALEAGEWTLDLTRSESVVYNKRYGFVPSNGVYTITYQYTKNDVVVTDEREFTPTQDGTISFTDDIITSINGIEIENAPVEYFNLQGVRVANPENGLYIRRQGNKVEKIFLKK